jgi:hypothetical protein
MDEDKEEEEEEEQIEDDPYKQMFPITIEADSKGIVTSIDIDYYPCSPYCQETLFEAMEIIRSRELEHDPPKKEDDSFPLKMQEFKVVKYYGYRDGKHVESEDGFIWTERGEEPK